MFKKSLIILISILCVFIFFTGCNNSKTQTQSKGGLKINNWSSSLGAVDETDLDKTKFFYSINLTNENEKDIFIKFLDKLK